MSKIFLPIVCLVLFTGCEQKARERHYQEIVIEAPEAASSTGMNDPHAGLGLDIPIIKQSPGVQSDLLWDVPSGLRETAGSAMRVASFKRIDHPDDIDVSIVTLSGTAGGLEANLTRWASQIHLDLTQDIARFIQDAVLLKTKDGLDLKLFDFSKLQQGQDPVTKSTVAAMIQMKDSTVFVKMTGTIKTVEENREAFKALARSVRQK